MYLLRVNDLSYTQIHPSIEITSGPGFQIGVRICEFIVQNVQGVADYIVWGSDLTDEVFLCGPVSRFFENNVLVLTSNMVVSAIEVRTISELPDNQNNNYEGFIGAATVEVSNVNLEGNSGSFRLHVDWSSGLNILIRIQFIALPMGGWSAPPFPKM